MSRITTHVIDSARGRPASGVAVTLERLGDDPLRLGEGETDSTGRLRDLVPDGAELAVGTYRLTFATGAYFRSQNAKTFYPQVSVEFEVRDPGEDYHIPLLLSPYGYSTYRGS
jgi:5-hydroxyisourate hydrolase